MGTKKTSALEGTVAKRSPAIPDRYETLNKIASSFNNVPSIAAVFGLCLIAIVMLKLFRPDTEIYSFLGTLIVLSHKILSRMGASGGSNG